MRRSKHDALRRLRRSAGVGLVTAIFLLVVLAGMGVAMVTLSTAQQASASLDLLGARAYQAARAGIEFGLYRALRKDTCSGNTESLALPAGSTLSGFAVSIRCTQRVTGTVTVRQLTSTACNFPNGAGLCPNPSNNPDYVQRKLTVQF